MKSLLLKRNIGKIYPNSNHSYHRRVMLIYHSVGSAPWSLNLENFQRQMEWLSACCEVLSISELLKSCGSDSSIQVGISFDDGYACLYEKAAPILREYNIQPIVYLNTGWVADCGERRRSSDAKLGHYPDEAFLNWEEVKKLHAEGWEFGSHGVDHLDLTAEGVEMIYDQLARSKQTIEEKLGAECPHFAYTWGRHNQRLRDAVKAAGYKFSVAAHHQPLGLTDNPFALPRLNIQQDYSLDDFINIISGKWDYLGKVHKLKRLIKGSD